MKGGGEQETSRGKNLWSFICTVYFQTDPCEYLSIYLPPFPFYFSQISLVWILSLSGRIEGRSLGKKFSYARFVFAYISEAWMGLFLGRGFLQFI